ncbi:MAG: cyanophycin synthetase [Ignavibacteriae bacterium]|nr:cyanophycin synthetase [Ignavibacteriota bacterium]
MKILEVRVMRGPNYWSVNWTKLIVMKLDIGEYEAKPTNEIPDFLPRLRELLPSLYEHRCSYDDPGGFFLRVEEGTWAGHVIEHIALELQTLAGMDTGFGRTRGVGEEGVYNVVFSYIEEEAGRYAGSAAVDLFTGIAEGKSLDELRTELDEMLQKLREIREDVRFGPSTGSIVEEAARRGIPHIRLNSRSLVQLGYGKYQKRIQATVTGRTNMIAVDIAGDKELTKELLGSMGVPVPRGYALRDKDEIERTIRKIGGFPIAVKPLNANHGRGITVGLNSLEEVQQAFEVAKEHARWVILERSLVGKDFRALVVNNQLVAVAERTPAHVVGDGEKTIQELIDITNQDPRRGYGHENVLTEITVDHQTERLIGNAGYALDSVLPEGECLFLKSTANLSTGGTAIDRTDETHPDNIFLFERIAQIVGLDVAGIDIVAPDVSTPIEKNGGGIIEVNAAPGFRMHLAPSEGIPRNVADHVVSMLFPPGAEFRVPIIAITGTNGKTTTTRLIAHILKGSGRHVGFTTSDGTYLGNRLVSAGDNTGPVSAQMVLRDPMVEVAVLESARGGLLRSGLAFDQCDIAVVTNVAADHLGLRGIETVEDMARVKEVVPRTVRPNGYAVLNADDELVVGMRKNLDCNTALFSMDESNPHIQAHTTRGGVACVYENGWVTILKGKWKIRIEQGANIPITYGGKASFMMQNVLAATMASYILHNVSSEDLRIGLATFAPTVAQAPGRLNMIEVHNFSVLIDFAHNPAGLAGLEEFVKVLPQQKKTGVVGGTGDRRDEDIKDLGRLAARTFSKIYIREDDDRRGREKGEINELVKQGIEEVDSALPTFICDSSLDAIERALSDATEGELVVILADSVARTIKAVDEFRQRVAVP